MQSFRFDEALRHFFECQREEPHNPDYLSKTGYCYYQLGNLAEAKVYFNSVLKQDSNHVSTLNYLVNIEEQMLNYRAAFKNMQRLIELDSTNSYYHRSAGNIAEKMSEPLVALYHYVKANKLNPNDQSALLSLCKLYVSLDQLEIADTLLDRALWKQPGNLLLLYSSAEINYRLRVFEQVLPPMFKALEMGDTNLAYLPLLPFSLSQLDSCEAALPWFEYILERKNPTEQMHYFMGFCYQKQGEFTLSLEHFNKAIEQGISPNIGTYYQRIGDVNSAKKDYRKSVEAYETALAYKAADPVIHFHLAVGYDHLYTKKKQKPLRLYKQYIATKDTAFPDFMAYAKQRVKELEYYEKNMWKGD